MSTVARVARPAVQRGADQLLEALTSTGWDVTVERGRPLAVERQELRVTVTDNAGVALARITVGPTPMGGMGRSFLVRPVIDGLQHRRVLTLKTAATLARQYARAATLARTPIAS